MDRALEYPKCLKKFQPNLSAQAQKFKIFEKKNILWVFLVRAKKTSQILIPTQFMTTLLFSVLLGSHMSFSSSLGFFFDCSPDSHAAAAAAILSH